MLLWNILGVFEVKDEHLLSVVKGHKWWGLVVVSYDTETSHGVN